MHSKFLLVGVFAITPLMTFAQIQGPFLKYTYTYDYALQSIEEKREVVYAEGDAHRTGIVFANIDGKYTRFTCVNKRPGTRRSNKVNFNNRECDTIIFSVRINNSNLGADIDDAKSRAYCLAFFGKDAVPYLKYKLNKAGKTELVSATCIKNTHKVGDPAKGLQRTCYKGVKRVNMSNGATCVACIERYNSIGDIYKQNTPGVQCATPRVSVTTGGSRNTPVTGTKDRPVHNRRDVTTEDNTADDSTVSIVNTGENSYNGGDYSGVTTGAGGTGTGRQQQYSGAPIIQAASPPQRRQPSLLDIIGKRLLGNKNKKPKKIMPECEYFKVIDNEIELGESTILKWILKYTSSAYIAPGIGLVNPEKGAIKISPKETTTYTIQTHNRNGYGSCEPVKVVVKKPQKPSEPIPSDFALECSPPKLRTNGDGIVRWRCSGSSKSSKGESAEYPIFTTSNKAKGVVKLTNMQKTGKFTVRCFDDNKKELEKKSCTIEVADNIYDGTPTNKKPKIILEADKTQVEKDGIVTITWQADNVDGCKIIGPDNFSRYSTKGSITARMLQTSAFTLSCVSKNVILPNKELTIYVK